MKPVITKRSEESIQKTKDFIDNSLSFQGYRPIKYYCKGHGETGRGETPEDAYNSWYFEMVMSGKQNLIIETKEKSLGRKLIDSFCKMLSKEVS